MAMVRNELHKLTQDLLSKDEALRISEERYKELVESINDIIFTSDLQGVILYISPSVMRISSYLPEEFIGQNASKFVHRDYHEDLERIIINIKHELPAKPSIIKTLDKDGSSRYIRISSKYHKQNKEIITGTIVDVTELILMQKKLELSEQKYKAIVEDQTELIFRALPDGALIFTNSAFNRYFNNNADDLLGKSFFDLLPQEDQINVIETLKNLTKENPTAMIIHKANVNDKEHHLQCFYRMIFDERSLPLIIHGIARDITRQIKIEQILYRRCSILQSLSDTMEAMVWVKDLQGRYMFASGMLSEKILKRDGYDILGCKDEDLLPEDAHNITTIADDIVQKEKKTCRFYVIHNISNREIWLDVKKNVLYDISGFVVGIVSVAFDISSEQDKIKAGLERRIASGEIEKINNYVYRLEKV